MPNNMGKNQARTLAIYCNKLYKMGFIGSTEGNLSVRLPNKTVLITPVGINKAQVATSDIVRMSINGRVISGKHKPSSEYRLHLEIYKRRPDISAICHAHPIYATSFAVAGKPLDKVILPEVVATIGLIPISEYGVPGSSDLALKVAMLAENFESVLIRNHGVVTIGKNLEEVFNRMEVTERYAQIMFNAMIIGKALSWPQKLSSQLPGFNRIKKQTALLKSDKG
jgi:L-fuculose-phosphate aldolase